MRSPSRSRARHNVPHPRPGGLVKFHTVARGLVDRSARAHRVRPAHPCRERNPPRLRVRFAAGDRGRARPPAPTPRCERGGRGLAEAYVDGWWDSPDVTAVIEVAARNLPRHRRVPAPAHARARAVAPRPRVPDAQHARALARGHRRPLRPRQRPLRADARRDDDVFERDLRAPGHDPGRRVADQAGPDLREARPAAVRPRARDRHRLGRVRAARGADARLPRDHHDVLARAARAGARARPRRRARGPRDGPARRLPRARPAPTTSSSRSR